MPKVSDTPRKLLIVCGPTATGKTKLAVRLAKRFTGELINADSRQVYKELDVLTGKDTKDLAGVPVWLYDVAVVGREFSVSHYRRLAAAAAVDISRRGKLPILVGGSGLYIRAAVTPFETIDIPPDGTKRKQWNTQTVAELQNELRGTDEARLAGMNHSDRNNPRRLIRALEIARWKKNNAAANTMPEFDCFWIGLKPDMTGLTGKIRQRVDLRWDSGALEEVKRHPHAVATGVIPITRFFRGELNEAEAKTMWVGEEVSYAKRQMTWFKKNPSVHWYDAARTDPGPLVEKDVASWYTRDVYADKSRNIA